MFYVSWAGMMFHQQEHKATREDKNVVDESKQKCWFG